MTDPGPTFTDARYGDPATAPLLAGLHDEMVRRYGSPDATPVDGPEFDPPGGAFVVVEVDGEPVACGGLRRHDAVTGEIKRMFVADTHRRRGLASALLTELEGRARAAGYARVVLVTWTAQQEAMAVYEARGYRPIVPFGHYADSPECRCYATDL